jgi:streptogramin lyase
MSNATDLAKMARDNGIETRKLANNSFSTDKIFQIGQGEFIGRNNTQTGNGNVNATQSYPDISLTSPLSAPFDATTAWRSLSAYLNQVAATNRSISTSSVYTEVFATNAYPVEAGAQNWEGGVLHPNGKIYSFPENASVILVIDPDSNTTTTIGAGSFGTVGNKYQGSILAPNGKIYGIPCGSSTTSRPQTIFQLLDPSNNTITAYASIASLPQTNAFQGGVCAPNGKLYLTPSTSSIFYFIDPSNNTVSAFATYVTNSALGGQNYSFGCVGPNGKIYVSPTGATVGRIIDPDTNTITTFGITGGSLPQLGAGILAPNGKIYFVPNHSIGYILDPFNNNTISTYSCAPAITGATSSFGGRLAPNGKIYFASWTGTFFGMLDPDNNTVTQLGTVASVGYLGMVLTPKGKLVLIPAAATSITAYNLNLNNNFNQNVCLSPFYNKA